MTYINIYNMAFAIRMAILLIIIIFVIVLRKEIVQTFKDFMNNRKKKS